jgi:hypothetical protein
MNYMNNQQPRAYTVAELFEGTYNKYISLLLSNFKEKMSKRDRTGALESYNAIQNYLIAYLPKYFYLVEPFIYLLLLLDANKNDPNAPLPAPLYNNSDIYNQIQIFVEEFMKKNNIGAVQAYNRINAFFRTHSREEFFFMGQPFLEYISQLVTDIRPVDEPLPVSVESPVPTPIAASDVTPVHAVTPVHVEAVDVKPDNVSAVNVRPFDDRASTLTPTPIISPTRPPTKKSFFSRIFSGGSRKQKHIKKRTKRRGTKKTKYNKKK